MWRPTVGLSCRLPSEHHSVTASQHHSITASQRGHHRPSITPSFSPSSFFTPPPIVSVPLLSCPSDLRLPLGGLPAGRLQAPQRQGLPHDGGHGGAADTAGDHGHALQVEGGSACLPSMPGLPASPPVCLEPSAARAPGGEEGHTALPACPPTACLPCWRCLPSETISYATLCPTPQPSS